MPTPPTPDDSLAQTLSHSARLAGEIRSLLLKQRQALVQAGLTTPAGVLSSLEQIAQSLERASRQASDQAHELGQLRALAEIGHLVNSSLDLTTVLNEVMDTIVRLTGAERGFLMLRDDDDPTKMAFRIARNLERESLEESEFEVSHTVVDRVVREGVAVVTTNAQEDPRFGRQESVVAYNLRSILCVPLKLKDELTGVIYADNRVRAGLFTEKERNLLASFANQAAVAIENARLFASVKRSLDEVTRLKDLMDNVLASIDSGVLTADVSRSITLANRAAEAILAAPPPGLIGTDLGELLPLLDSGLLRTVDQVEREDQRFAGVEVNPTLPARGPVSLRLNLSPLRDARQETQGVAIVVEDLTETKRLRSKYAIFQRMVSPAVIDSLPDDPAHLELGGRRQEVTVLFADVRGFSGFSEAQTPERLLDVLNRYLGMAAEAVLLQEGTLDKFMGDAVMAVFNAPLPQPDHALRAVRAALAMKSDVQAFHEAVDPRWRLQFGIGIHTGVAVVGMVGTRQRLDYSAIGDDVNVAKRIQEIAAPGQVLISDAVQRLVQDDVQAQSLGPQKVKGREQAVHVYEVLGV